MTGRGADDISHYQIRYDETAYLWPYTVEYDGHPVSVHVTKALAEAGVERDRRRRRRAAASRGRVVWQGGETQ
jgi:hypothetical protein